MGGDRFVVGFASAYGHRNVTAGEEAQSRIAFLRDW